MKGPEKMEKLVDILKRLNDEENPQEVRAEAKEFLRSVSPAELSLAEQKLMEEGLDTQSLENLCSVHMEALEDELERRGKEDLPPGHMIHTLMSEHEMIVDFVEELGEVNASIQQMDSYDPDREEFDRLAHIAHHLVEAELHHQREEDVLFPEVEKRGISGPPDVMRMEHDQLRERKHDLKELAEIAGEMDFKEFQRKIDITARYIVDVLPDHIFKEDNILYPAALEVIEEDDLWARLKQQCDRIGYCCFTPDSEEG